MGFLDGYKTYDTSKGYGNSRQWKNSFYEKMTSGEAEEILQRYAEETPYSILGVQPDVTIKELKAAFRKLLMKWHPDKNLNSEESTEMTKKIIAAYTKITGG